MSSRILTSSASVHDTNKCGLYENGRHISALSPFCRRTLPNNGCLLWFKYIPNLIPDVSLEEKSQVAESGDLGGHSKAPRCLY